MDDHFYNQKQPVLKENNCKPLLNVVVILDLEKNECYMCDCLLYCSMKGGIST